MNLNNPTKQELRDILTICDDNAGFHKVWVSPSGQVFVSRHVEGETYDPPFSEERAKFFLEGYVEGNGYVGPEAAADDEWMDNLYLDLTNAWSKGLTGLVDYSVR